MNFKKTVLNKCVFQKKISHQLPEKKNREQSNEKKLFFLLLATRIWQSCTMFFPSGKLLNLVNYFDLIASKQSVESKQLFCYENFCVKIILFLRHLTKPPSPTEPLKRIRNKKSLK